MSVREKSRLEIIEDSAKALIILVLARRRPRCVQVRRDSSCVCVCANLCAYIDIHAYGIYGINIDGAEAHTLGIYDSVEWHLVVVKWPR